MWAGILVDGNVWAGVGLDGKAAGMVWAGILVDGNIWAGVMLDGNGWAGLCGKGLAGERIVGQ